VALRVTNYHTVGGRIRAERTSGFPSHDYLDDALGSVTHTVSPTDGTTMQRLRYLPYGNRHVQAPTPLPRFNWVGAWGYRATGRQHADTYVRARHYSQQAEARWTSVDPLWPDEMAYQYAYSNPANYVDSFGTNPLLAAACITCLACAANYIGVCYECGSDWNCWSKCISDITAELPPIVGALCGKSCELCASRWPGRPGKPGPVPARPPGNRPGKPGGGRDVCLNCSCICPVSGPAPHCTGSFPCTITAFGRGRTKDDAFRDARAQCQICREQCENGCPTYEKDCENMRCECHHTKALCTEVPC
jgi:RHS repeat-associated protein